LIDKPFGNLGQRRVTGGADLTQNQLANRYEKV